MASAPTGPPLNPGARAAEAEGAPVPAPDTASNNGGGPAPRAPMPEPDVIFRAAGEFLSGPAAGSAPGAADTGSAEAAVPRSSAAPPQRLSVLDAGTGRSSLAWLLRSRWVRSWAAVTASASMQADVSATLAAAAAALPVGAALPPGRIVLGSWDDPLLLRGEGGVGAGGGPEAGSGPEQLGQGQGSGGAANEGANEQFDVVLADYLLGSMDGFTPYRQDVLIERLLPHLAPGGTLVLVGLEPIPNSAPPPYDVVPLCARLRDATFLHAGQRPYREYPLSWVLRALRRAGLQPALVRRFPILYSADDLIKELNTARSRLAAVEARAGGAFAAALGAHIDEAEARTRATVGAQPGGRLSYGEDYLVCARRAAPAADRP